MREYASIPRGTRHLSGNEISAMVAERSGRAEITDACAAGIAAQWQAPRGHGAVFTSLCSHYRVQVDELHDAIADARAELGPVGSGGVAEHVRRLDRAALDALATWAMNGPTDSREWAFTRHVEG